MRCVVDTCVISETVRSSPERRVVDWLGAQREEDLHLSVLTIGELRKGIARLDESRRKAELAAWIDGELTERFGSRLLPVCSGVASLWGEIQARAERAGKRMPVVDGLIAATALHHGLAVATRNGGDMAVSGAKIVNPWE
ncbi:MAG: type II toxin-antitoxin system VapC family toxin [Proteobacteria bacterium]|nr:type II toxin-antitoxin system VapC family toxin [Pseudomonadota bacterium]